MENDLQKIKDDIRARTDILELIGGYTHLEQKGKNCWMGLCPFHADQRPSFSVHSYFQTYRCWSCGEKGDVFIFIQNKERLTFIEALRILAKRADISFEWHEIDSEPGG